MTIKIVDFHLDNNLIDEKSYGNILLYNIPCKTLISAESLHRIIQVYNGTRQ